MRSKASYTASAHDFPFAVFWDSPTVWQADKQGTKSVGRCQDPYCGGALPYNLFEPWFATVRGLEEGAHSGLEEHLGWRSR